jgi:hypothetical protein
VALPVRIIVTTSEAPALLGSTFMAVRAASANSSPLRAKKQGVAFACPQPTSRGGRLCSRLVAALCQPCSSFVIERREGPRRGSDDARVGDTCVGEGAGFG